MIDNITPISEVPVQRLKELLSGPQIIGSHPVVEGREIRQLRVYEEGDQINIILDNRLSIAVPEQLAVSVCWLIANALAIGAGYSHMGAESKDHPFAPKVVGLDNLPNQ